MLVQRLLALLLMVLILPPIASAQETGAVSPASSSDRMLNSEEIDALVAPIALYPDSLLSLVLMASTYPLEVVQADRWSRANPDLKGDARKSAVEKQTWDGSVKSLAASSDVLAMMSSKLEWMLKLGDAVLAQQPDVMNAVQRLRARADGNNKLTSTKEQKIIKSQAQDGQQFIAIEQTDPETLYVPYYDPSIVYGDWPYSDYPPYYFGYPEYIGAGVIAAGLAFGAGWGLRRWASGGNFWGGGINWNGGRLNTNRPRVNPLNGGNWQHRPEHRQGMRYNNAQVRQQFGNNGRGGAGNRTDGRGPGRNQSIARGAGAGLGAATRPAKPSHRASAGHRHGGRQTAGHRPSSHAGGRHAHSGRAANLGFAQARGNFGGVRHVGGGGFRGGGGGFRGGGGGFRGGGRRSDVNLKHDIVLLGHLPNGLGYYRFSYNGSDRAYVGVMAQELQTVMPEAVARGRDGYLRVFYDKLGIRFQTYEDWIRSGARMPTAVRAVQ